MNAAIVDRGGGPVVAGTRITVLDVYGYLEAGWEARGIAAALGLCVDQVDAAREYIERHSDAVRDEFSKVKQRIEQGNSAEIQAKLARASTRLHERLRDLRQSGCQGNGNGEHPG